MSAWWPWSPRSRFLRNWSLVQYQCLTWCCGHNTSQSKEVYIISVPAHSPSVWILINAPFTDCYSHCRKTFVKILCHSSHTSVRLRAPMWKVKASRVLCCGVANISWSRGVLIKIYTLGIWASTLVICTSSHWLVLWALQRSDLRSHLFRPSRRRPEIASRVCVSKVSIYSIYTCIYLYIYTSICIYIFESIYLNKNTSNSINSLAFFIY